MHAGNAVTSEEIAQVLVTFTQKEMNLDHIGYLKC